MSAFEDILKLREFIKDKFAQHQLSAHNWYQVEQELRRVIRYAGTGDNPTDDSMEGVHKQALHQMKTELLEIVDADTYLSDRDKKAFREKLGELFSERQR